MTNISHLAKNSDPEMVSEPLFKCACIKIADLLQYHCEGKGKKHLLLQSPQLHFEEIHPKTVVKSKKNIPRKQTEFRD